MPSREVPLFLTLVNRAYWPGLLTFSYSLSVNAGAIPKKLTILQEDPIPARLKSRIESFGLRCDYINFKQFGDLQSPVKQAQPRLEFAFKKLSILQYPHQGTVCFIDVDMLCLNDMSGVETMRHFSVAPDRGIREPKIVNGYPAFNTGFVVYSPSRDLYNSVYKYATTTDRPIHL